MFSNVKKYEPSWRPAFSGIVVVLWLIFIIAWLAFFSAGIQPYEKKIAVVLLSLLVIIILVGGVWTIWAARMVPKEGKQMMKMLGFKSRMIASVIIPLSGISFLIYYFWEYDFRILQHIATVIITILVAGLILGIIWSSWKKCMSSDFEKRMEEMGEEIGRKVEEAFDDEK